MTVTIAPSPQQQAIVDLILDGGRHLIIQALAGTGKTTTLFMLLPYMSGDVFMGAYNVSIRAEFDRRLRALRLSNCRVDAKTMHAAGLAAFNQGKDRDRCPKVEGNKIPLMIEEIAEATKNPAYTKYERFIAKLVGFGKRAGFRALVEGTFDQWVELIEYYGVWDELPDGAMDGDGEGVPSQLLDQLIDMTNVVYQASLDACQKELDFDDMLLAPLYFNSRFKKYDWVLIDELQDCSAIRQEIAVRMLKPGGILIGVGDQNQNIYGFSGCMHNEMDVLQQRLNADVLPLSVTYRCPKAVVSIANTWVPDLTAADSAPEGIIRAVWLDPEPCPKCQGTGAVGPMATANEWCDACGGTGKKQQGFWDEAQGLGAESVILCRNNKPLVELAYQLLRKNIPCQIEGRDFAGSLIKLCQRWKTRELTVLESRLLDYREREAEKWRRKKNEERAAGVEDKVDTLLALIDGVRSSGKTKVSDLVDKINAMFSDTDKDHKPRVLTLSSIHKSKGKEWPRVYILGRNKYMPSKWAKRPHEIQAENNVAYVAVTRAMEELVDIVVTTERKRK